ncbi:MAG: DUF4919 domain-containing protein [Bacteroidales bacterium]|nr:DUF4919 domain-containing protein [Bacteroidales bacterium]
MKKAFLVLSLLSAFSFAQAQKIVNIDFDNVKEETTTKKSDNYYPKLLERYFALDTSFTEEEYMFLYYGYTFRPEYSPYGTPEAQDKFLELYYAEEFQEAIPFGLEVLKENPVHIKIVFKVLVCYYALEKLDTAQLYAKQYYGLLGAIYNSGDGMSVETAWVVNRVSDEYEILSDLELDMTEQALLEGPTDRLTISREDQKYDPPVEELYFNVAKPFEQMSKMFDD